jgi:two-component system sensor histidine kinase/response regulator
MNIKPSILIIDDAIEYREILTSILEPIAGSIKDCSSGKLALKLLEEHEFDIILLDIKMPVMDGFETCEIIKSNPKFKSIPILFISALSEIQDITTGFKLGAVDYITKPFYPEEVIARVKTHIELDYQRKIIKQQYNELKALEESRDSFVNMIVHDMYSPITILSMCVETMRFSEIEGNTSENLLEELQFGVDQLTEMTASILDVSRMESKKMPLHKTPVQFFELLRNIVSKEQLITSGKGIEIQLIGEDIEFYLDGKIITRVITNLLTNAIKFTPKNGNITVELINKADGVEIKVSDSGCGISSEHIEGIFEKYGQVESAQKNIKRSTGLGLTFCKLAVELHGGKIGVESAPENGSSFWFTLPSC